jgi:hypothetical protein
MKAVITDVSESRTISVFKPKSPHWLFPILKMQQFRPACSINIGRGHWIVIFP